MDDLINFSNKEQIQRLTQSIFYFIESYKEISSIELTGFTQNLKKKIWYIKFKRS